MSHVGKSIETESRLVVGRDSGEGHREWLLMITRCLSWVVKMGMDYGDGCTTL